MTAANQSLLGQKNLNSQFSAQRNECILSLVSIHSLQTIKLKKN